MKKVPARNINEKILTKGLYEDRYGGTFAFMKINVEMSKNNRLIRARR